MGSKKKRDRSPGEGVSAGVTTIGCGHEVDWQTYEGTDNDGEDIDEGIDGKGSGGHCDEG